MSITDLIRERFLKAQATATEIELPTQEQPELDPRDLRRNEMHDWSRSTTASEHFLPFLDLLIEAREMEMRAAKTEWERGSAMGKWEALKDLRAEFAYWRSG